MPALPAWSCQAEPSGASSARTMAFSHAAISSAWHPQLGEALAGTSLTDADIGNAVDEHLSINEPLGDVQASGEYRVELARVCGKRALKAARDRARA